MLTRTKQMLNYKDYGLTRDCYHYFPFDEGAGTTITDVVTGATLTDAGLTWATPYAGKIGITTQALSKGSINTPHQLDFLIVTLQSNATTGTFSGFQLESTTPQWKIAIGAVSVLTIDDPTSPQETTTPTDDVGAGNLRLEVGTFDNSTGEMEALGADGTSGDLTSIGTKTYSVATPDIDFGTTDDKFVFSTAGFESECYGAALFCFADGLPTAAEIKTGCEWMRDQWLAGNKKVYSDW